MSGIIRIHKQRDYSVIYNGAMRDTRLSFGARGVLAYLLTKPDDWEVRSKDLESQSPAGRDAIRRMLAELETCGYLKRERERDASGRYIWQTHIYESPKTDFPAQEKPTQEKAAIKEVRSLGSTEKKKNKERVQHRARENFEVSQNRQQATPPDELSQEPLFDSLCDVCNVHYANLSDPNRRKFEETLRALQRAGATDKGIEAFGERWRWYWRCHQNGGRSPFSQEVLECWQEVMNIQYVPGLAA